MYWVWHVYLVWHVYWVWHVYLVWHVEPCLTGINPPNQSGKTQTLNHYSVKYYNQCVSLDYGIGKLVWYYSIINRYLWNFLAKLSCM